MVHEVWGQKDHPSGLDRNPVPILALSFHITGHHAPTRASFHPKTRQEDFFYDTKSSWALKSRFGESYTFLAPLLLISSRGNGPKCSIWPTTGPFYSIFVAMILIYQKNIIDTKMAQFGVLDGEIWRICGEKWGSRRGKSDVCPKAGSFQAQVFSASGLHLGTELRNCQFWGPHSIHILKVPLFRASVDPLWYFSNFQGSWRIIDKF